MSFSASQQGFPALFGLSMLDGTNGFAIQGKAAGDASGISVSGAGDVNGDGFDDLIIGASAADPDGRGWAGESYVVFGQAVRISCRVRPCESRWKQTDFN